MSTTTPYLDLFKIIPEEDAKKTFNFYEILNNNWDKLDNAYSIQNSQIQTVLGLMYNTVYRIGQPIIRLDNYLAENEVRLEGEEKLISEFPQLYQVYGDTYGEARTGYFKLPDCRNRVFWGAETFGYIEAGLPNIKGTIAGLSYDQKDSKNGMDGAFYWGTTKVNGAGSGESDRYGYFDASRNDAVHKNARGIYRNNCYTVQPPAIKVRVVTRFK